jgi:three-Cys-motif partner protein
MSDVIDQLGDWSQIKHEILEKYAHAYTKVIAAQPLIRKSVYIDAYAGSGFGMDRDTGAQLRGSALRAVGVTPPFHELHFVEDDEEKASILENATSSDKRVTVHRGDGVGIVTKDLLPRCRWNDFHRALCLLDPYDLSVPWTLVEHIGRMKSVEIFYNFMIMDANRNVLWNRPELVPPERLPKMDLVWGDRSWQQALYAVEPDLFGGRLRKLPNEGVAEAFRERLKTVAGFPYVPQPIAMRNSLRSTVYYVFFAGHNQTGAKIVEDIFRKHRH